MNTRLSTIALSIALAWGAGNASAELARVGPIDKANGYPQWYQDKTGLTLEFCQNQTQAELDGGWCVLLPPDLPAGTAPELFPQNFPDEHFYWLANAGDRRAVANTATGGVTLTALLIMGIEGAFSLGPVSAGDQVVFARIRMRVDPLPFDGDYTIYTPYGKFSFPGQTAGSRLFVTEDIGLSPGVFTEALKGKVGPFLLPSTTPGGRELPPIPTLLAGQDPFQDILVNTAAATPYPNNGRKYVADPARLGPVTGSTVGDYVVNDNTTRNPNLFRVEGPNGFVYETTDFTLAGRVFEGAVAGSVSVDRASYARPAPGNNVVSVYATAQPVMQARIPAGAPSATVSTDLAYFDAACTPTRDQDGNLGAPYSAPGNASATQMLSAGSSYFGQSRPATLPTEVCMQANAISAGGQATTTYQPVQLGDQISISEALYDPSTQAMSVKAKSGDAAVQQDLRVEGFGPIDKTTGQLIVSELLAPPSKVVVTSSGRGINDMQVTPGNVSGGTGAALPVANNDTATVFEDCQNNTPPTGSVQCTTGVVIDVLHNDTNATSGTPTLTVSSPATLGKATVTPDGKKIAYVPNLNASGADRFGYKVTVNGKVSNEASVAVTITPVNDPPTANADSTNGLRGQPSTFNVFANDTDPDGAADLATAVIVTGNANLGLAAGASFAGGAVTFTPIAAAPTGPAVFTYKAVDKGGLESAPVSVTVNIAAAEAITGTRARYVADKARWTITGNDSLSAGQTITISYANGTFRTNGNCNSTNNAVGQVIGTAPVTAGTFSLDTTLTSQAGIRNPTNTSNANFWCTVPTQVRFNSSQSSSTATFAIEIK